MSDLKMKCASCGLPGHRYGRNEGMDRYDPMACINQLRGVLEDLLANGQRVEPDYEAAANVLDGYLGFDTENFKIARCAVDAAIGDKLLIDPPTTNSARISTRSVVADPTEEE